MYYHLLLILKLFSMNFFIQEDSYLLISASKIKWVVMYIFRFTKNSKPHELEQVGAPQGQMSAVDNSDLLAH